MICVAIIFCFGIYFALWVLSRITSPIETRTIIGFSCGISAFIAVSLLVTKYSYSLVSRVLYRIVVYFWGFLVYYTIFAVIYVVLGLIFGPISKVAGVLLVLVTSCTIWTYGVINAQFLRTERIDVHLPHVSRRLTIAHLSDIHLGPIYGREHVAKLARELNRLAPDLVVITGDLFDGSTPVSPEMIAPFDDVKAKIYMVLGNHDVLVAGEERVCELIRTTKITLMQNEQIVHDKTVNILGITYSPHWDYLDEQLRAARRNTEFPNVLLYHIPAMTADKLEEFGIDVHLGGHTHGGQMFPFNLTAALMFTYVRGLHVSRSGKAYVFVADGAGTAGPPLRVMSSTSISLIDIHP